MTSIRSAVSVVCPDAGGRPTFPVTVRIETPGGETDVEVMFALHPLCRAIANVDKISLGRLKHGDRVKLSLLSKTEKPVPVVVEEVIVPRDGDVVIEPGSLVVEQPCTCCCEEECTCDEEPEEDCTCCWDDECSCDDGPEDDCD